MATIAIPNAPKNLTMLDFKAISDRYNGLQRSCRFVVQIVPVGQYLRPYGTFLREMLYLCEVAEFPGRSFMNVDVRYYGPNHKLPFQSQYEDLNLTFVCRNASLERQFFDDWQLMINPINTWDFNYRDDYRSVIHVYQYEDTGRGGSPTSQYWMSIYNAYPVLLNPQPITWADDQFQRLIVSFTYTHWSRPGIDPIPRGSDTGRYSYSLVQGSRVIR